MSIANSILIIHLSADKMIKRTRLEELFEIHWKVMMIITCVRRRESATLATTSVAPIRNCRTRMSA